MPRLFRGPYSSQGPLHLLKQGTERPGRTLLKVTEQAQDPTSSPPPTTCSPSLASMRLCSRWCFWDPRDLTWDRAVYLEGRTFQLDCRLETITSVQEFRPGGGRQELGGQCPGDPRASSRLGAGSALLSLGSVAAVKLSCPAVSPGREAPSSAEWKLGS